ncbi:hypothetical protein [Streptomyces sp. NPDC047042]|uniref:hypothetical protein n=1 Tax=Streptomyces sp. NPDC047042 TaxID=3154807 RepID=UPI0033E2D588
MSHPTSTDIAGRIEDLHGAPLADLATHAQDQPPGMLSALLGLHHSLALAERSITSHRDRLAQLVHPDHQIGAHEVSHVLDCARRLAEAVAVRDVQAATGLTVLQSLGRVTSPDPGRNPPRPPSPRPPWRRRAPLRAADPLRAYPSSVIQELLPWPSPVCRPTPTPTSPGSPRPSP